MTFVGKLLAGAGIVLLLCFYLQISTVLEVHSNEANFKVLGLEKLATNALHEQRSVLDSLLWFIDTLLPLICGLYALLVFFGLMTQIYHVVRHLHEIWDENLGNQRQERANHNGGEQEIFQAEE